MIGVLLQMAALIACGVAWRVLRPVGLDVDVSRRVLTTLVYYLLLPALVVLVLWRTPLGADTVRIAALAASGVLAGLWLSGFVCRRCGQSKPVAGAVMLAAAFPNVTYLGLPVLEQSLGAWARSVAIQYDLFACTPLLLTVGILVARHHGQGAAMHPLKELLRVPALWAALLAVTANLANWPLPAGLQSWLQTLASGVVPLMLIALGMGLRWDTMRLRNLPPIAPVIVIQLILMPLLVWGLSFPVGLGGQVQVAVVLEAAMPSMVLGMVLCDRFGLDTGLYAMAVTVSTLLSLLTLPVWYQLLV